MTKNLTIGISIVVIISVFLAGYVLYKNNQDTTTNTTNTTNTTQLSNLNANPETENSANVYFVTIGDDGQSGRAIGCGDSLAAVPVTISLPSLTGDQLLSAKIEAALSQLFSAGNNAAVLDGKYNALAQSTLTTDEVIVVNGVATVTLSGQLQLGGVCDNPRVEAQITETVKQFSGLTSTTIKLNDKTLSEALSLK